jgi:hypothetical protein
MRINIGQTTNLFHVDALNKNMNGNAQEKKETDYRLLAETLKKECMEKDARIKFLEHRNQLLRSALERIKEMVSHLPEA